MKRVYLWVLCTSLCLANQLPLPRGPYKIAYTGDVSTNYITRWEFQKIGHFVYDPRLIEKYFPTAPGEGVTFDPKEVKPGDIVFARDPQSYFATIHPMITCPYILVVHGQSEERLTQELVPELDCPKILKYFTIHPPKVFHPKIVALPVGVKQRKDIYARKDELTKRFVEYRENPVKKHLLYCNFLNRTHESRPNLKKQFENADYCYSRDRCKFDDFIQDVAESIFVLSPPGKGIDANRTWEALLLGSIPIVISSQLNKLYEDLPVVIVDDWSEVTQEFLLQKYDEIIAQEYDLRKLYVDYWFEIIEGVRQEFLKEYTHSSVDTGG